jgi:tetratricopeptide (TPR) repeat protein
VPRNSKAIALKPDSATAHSLLGQLYCDLAPLTMMGGPRYGPRSEKALAQALALDPNHVDALVALAVNKMFTHQTFGGSLPRAIDLLKRAVELARDSDDAHAWLARALEMNNQHTEAVRAIQSARRINPARRWLQPLAMEIRAEAAVDSPQPARDLKQTRTDGL